MPCNDEFPYRFGPHTQMTELTLRLKLLDADHLGLFRHLAVALDGN